MGKRTAAGLMVFGTAFLLMFAGSRTARAEMKECVVKLTTGREIRAGHCYEKGDQVFMYRYGGYVGVPKSTVAEIATVAVNESVAPTRQDVPADAAPDESRNVGKAFSKSKKREKTEAEKLDEKIAGMEQSIKLHRNSQLIYCGQAATTEISPEPHIPNASQAIVSEATADAFTRNIQSRVAAHRANESCDFYSRKIPDLEQQLEELKRERDNR